MKKSRTLLYNIEKLSKGNYMELTSAQANKLLKQLSDEKRVILAKEEEGAVFVAATSENIADVRPEYDYSAVQNELREIDRKIRKIKHAINTFNTTYVIPEFDMTIDEMLVWLPQLTEMNGKLSEFAQRLPKTRYRSPYNTNLIEYEYANYPTEKALEDYNNAAATLSAAQVALDTANNTVVFNIEI